MQVQWLAREGRRTNQGYKMFHFVEVNGATYQVQASTREKAIEQAIELAKKEGN